MADQQQAENTTASPIRIIADNFAKTSLGIAFCIYALGFVIWHSFLGQYGISSSGNLQVECLSAAACYIIILLCFSLPPALIIKASKPENKEGWSIYAIVIAWSIVLGQVSKILFPASGVQDQTLSKAIAVIMVLHLIAAIAAKKLVPEGKLQKIIYNRGWFAFYLLLLAFVPILTSPSADLWFLFLTMLLYWTGAQFGIDAFSITNEQSYLGITIKILVAVSIMIGHSFLFGKGQFGKIPRSAGGGRPELAYVVLKKQNITKMKEILPIKDISKNIVGPLAVLERTDHDLIVALPESIASKKPYAIVLRNELFEAIKFIPSQ